MVVVMVMVVMVMVMVVMVVLALEDDDRTEACLASSSWDSSFGWIKFSTSSTEASFTFFDFEF